MDAVGAAVAFVGHGMPCRPPKCPSSAVPPFPVASVSTEKIKISRASHETKSGEVGYPNNLRGSCGSCQRVGHTLSFMIVFALSKVDTCSFCWHDVANFKFRER